VYRKEINAPCGPQPGSVLCYLFHKHTSSGMKLWRGNLTNVADEGASKRLTMGLQSSLLKTLKVTKTDLLVDW